VSVYRRDVAAESSAAADQRLHRHAAEIQTRLQPSRNNKLRIYSLILGVLPI